MFLRFIRKYQVPVFLLLAFSLYFLWEGAQSELVSKKLPGEKPSQSEPAVPPMVKKTVKRIVNEEKESEKRVSAEVSSEEQFSYEKEVRKVIELASSYPDSRESLISIVTKDDIYKEKTKIAKTHTMAEIRQNKMGAVRVLALKSLISKGQGKRERLANLDDVIARAKDPTIVKIAKSARESTEQGLSFFEDFSDAIKEMSL